MRLVNGGRFRGGHRRKAPNVVNWLLAAGFEPMLEAADGSSAVGSAGAMLATVAAKNTSGRGYGVVRILLGLILIVAALLKGYQLATEPVVGGSLFTSRAFLIGLVELEWLFGVWMLAGLHPQRTWQAAVVCFGAFACVSFYKGLAGDASCGCFGRVPVSPWVTFALDAGAVCALLRWRRATRGTEGPDQPPEIVCFFASRPVVVLSTALLLSIPSGLAMARYRPAALSDDGAILGDSHFVVLEPKTWVGRRFPLLESIDIGRELGQGEWLVVLYRHNCPHCEEVLTRYVELAERGTHDPSARRVALINLPPYGSSVPDPADQAYSIGRLSCERRWFVETPLLLELENGQVLDASLGI